MARMLLKAAVATALALLISTTNAQSTTAAAAGPITTGDCYNSLPSDFTSKGSYTFQTSGYCQTQCSGFSVMAITGGSTCYCGNELPSSSNKASSSSCNTPCQGFDTQMCGGTNFYQLYLTGDGSPGPNAAAGSSSSSQTSGNSQSATSSVPSVVTQSGKVVTVTAAAGTSSASSGSGGSSKVGIAVGVVVGLVAIAAIVGGLVVFLKRRRRLAIEEEHRRNAAVSNFVSGGKSETSSNTDSRLDPTVFNHRRNSLGSIADEQDFSRRILQVRNPDRESKSSNMA